jgi:hypothetical protein
MPCDIKSFTFSVIPAQAGIQYRSLDSRLRGNDGINGSRRALGHAPVKYAEIQLYAKAVLPEQKLGAVQLTNPVPLGNDAD